MQENPADYLLRNKWYIVKALMAIAEGYPVSGADDQYIVVDNPDFQEDNGQSPKLVIDVFMFRELAQRLDGR
jgi:hypothetical protein